MAVTGVHFILCTDWSRLLESDFTDFGWSSDAFSLVWELFGASDRTTWQNWFHILTNVTVLEIRECLGENNGFVFAKSLFNSPGGGTVHLFIGVSRILFQNNTVLSVLYGLEPYVMLWWKKKKKKDIMGKYEIWKCFIDSNSFQEI